MEEVGAEGRVPRRGVGGFAVGTAAPAHIVGGDQNEDVFGADGGGAAEEFFDGGVADGDASVGAGRAMDHDVAAQLGTAILFGTGAVESIGVVEAEGKVVGIGGEQAFDAVKAFGNLPVVLAEFGTKTTVEGCDFVCPGGVPARGGYLDAAFELENEDAQGVAGRFGHFADFRSSCFDAGNGGFNGLPPPPSGQDVANVATPDMVFFESAVDFDPKIGDGHQTAQKPLHPCFHGTTAFRGWDIAAS